MVQEDKLCRRFRRRHSVGGSGGNTLHLVQNETLRRGYRRNHSVGGSVWRHGVGGSVGDTAGGSGGDTQLGV